MSFDPRTGVRVGLAFVLLGVLTHTRADPDLWGHVVFGRDTIASGETLAGAARFAGGEGRGGATVPFRPR